MVVELQMCNLAGLATCTLLLWAPDSIETVAPSGDHCFAESVVPSGYHDCIDIVLPSSDHCHTETILPSCDHYCIPKVVTPSDHLHTKGT